MSKDTIALDTQLGRKSPEAASNTFQIVFDRAHETVISGSQYGEFSFNGRPVFVGSLTELWKGTQHTPYDPLNPPTRSAADMIRMGVKDALESLGATKKDVEGISGALIREMAPSSRRTSADPRLLALSVGMRARELWGARQSRRKNDRGRHAELELLDQFASAYYRETPEGNALIARVSEALSPQDREVFQHVVEGYSVRVMSSRLGRNVAAIGASKVRIARRVRQVLKEANEVMWSQRS
jgi:hypothetical protein